MASIPRTYLTTSKAEVGNIPPKNGQIISVWDSDEVYYDAPANGIPSGTPVRRKISGVKVVQTLPSSPMSDILYVYTPASPTPTDLRIWVNNNWDIVGNNSTDTQVTTTKVTNSKFYLAGSTSEDTATGTLVKNANIYVDNGVLNASVTDSAHAESADLATNAEYDNEATPKKISSYINDVSRSGSTLTFTRGDGTTKATTLPNTTYNVFNASTAGLVDSPTPAHTQQSDSTGLLLTGSGWVNKSNITFNADRANKDGSGNTITTTYYANASWNSTNRNLTLTKGDGSTTTVLNIPDTTYSVFAQGSAGLVPAPTSAQLGSFLKGDGTWASVPVPNYTGASGSSAGVAGLVPPASSGQQNYYLKGDATWGTTFAQGSSGLVPAPTSSDSGKFLKGDGTWASPAAAAQNTVGANVSSNQLYLVGVTTTTTGDLGTQSYSNTNTYMQGGELYSNGTKVVNLSDSQALTNKTYEGYSLGDACEATLSTTLNNSSPNGDVPTNNAVRNYVQSVKSSIQTDMDYKANNIAIAPLFDSTATYAVGDFCMYDDGNGSLLYQCITAISTAGDWDSSKWSAPKVVSNYFSGNYAEAEHIVGNWIDGSILYEQTITLSSITASTAQTVAHGITADKIFIHEGITEYTISSTNYHGVISAYNTTAGTDELCIRIDDTNIGYLAGTNLAGAIAYLKIRYTKPAL